MHAIKLIMQGPAPCICLWLLYFVVIFGGTSVDWNMVACPNLGPKNASSGKQRASKEVKAAAVMGGRDQ